MAKDKRYEELRREYSGRSRLLMSLMILLLALVAMSAATVAWFTIADRGRVDTLEMVVTSGPSMRFDLNAHGSFEDYIVTLNFEQIADRIRTEHGFDMRNVPLEPVTTNDGQHFVFEDGSAVDVRSGAYLEFTLHFMALEDMNVHLTSEDGDRGDKGTEITSRNPKLASAMRISFTADGQTCIYDPGRGAGSTGGAVKTFGLPAGAASHNESSTLFALKKNQDKTVVVRVWLEGTDENCTGDIKGADYQISMRFVGTDKDGNVVDR